MISLHPVNNFNNYHPFLNYTSWLCHISIPCALIWSRSINTNEKRNRYLVNNIQTFGRKCTIIMIWIGFIIRKPMVFNEYILNTCMINLADPQWICITIENCFALLLVWNFIVVNAFACPITRSLEILGRLIFLCTIQKYVTIPKYLDPDYSKPPSWNKMLFNPPILHVPQDLCLILREFYLPTYEITNPFFLEFIDILIFCCCGLLTIPCVTC